MNKVGFIMGSGYLLISMVDLAMTRHKDDFKVAFILNHYKGSDVIYKRVVESKVFDRVYYLPKRQIVFTNREKFKQTFFSKKWLKTHLENYDYNNEFDMIYGGGMTELVTPLYQVAKTKNKHCEYYEVDDGGGFCVNYLDRYTTISRIVCGALRKHIPSKEMRGFFMFKKERYCAKALAPIYEIDDLKNNPELGTVLNGIYNVNEKQIEYYQNAQVIYLMSAFSDIEAKQYEKEVLKVSKEILKGKLLIKPHPGFEDGTETIDTFIPMEIIGLNCNLNDKILVSCCSTGLHSNTVLYDQSPKIIFLYKLFEQYMTNKSMVELFKKIAERYTLYYGKEDSVCVVDTLEEYLAMISNN